VPPGAGIRESSLLRTLQALKECPLGKKSVTRGLDGIVKGRKNAAVMSSREDLDHEEEMRLRKSKLEAQKARIVAQMAPVREDIHVPPHNYTHHKPPQLPPYLPPLPLSFLKSHLNSMGLTLVFKLSPLHLCQRLLRMGVLVCTLVIARRWC